MLAFVAFGCASPGPATLGGLKSYRVGGKTYVPLRDWEGFAETGVASWYGEPHHGRRTASGEVFDTRGGFTAAHKTLPFNVCARVQNLSTGESVVVRINDRGPFVKGRVIDLSRAAARRISLARAGVAKVRIQALSVADRKGGCA
jgi:rare lipoprotein A